MLRMCFSLNIVVKAEYHVVAQKSGARCRCFAERAAILKCTVFQSYSGLEEKTCFAKSSKESPLLASEPGSRSKKQLGISFNLRFLLMHGAHPLSCLAGCKGQSIFLHEQKVLKLFMRVS